MQNIETHIIDGSANRDAVNDYVGPAKDALYPIGISLVGGGWTGVVHMPSHPDYKLAYIRNQQGELLAYGALDADEFADLLAVVDPLRVDDIAYPQAIAAACRSCLQCVDSFYEHGDPVVHNGLS